MCNSILASLVLAYATATLATNLSALNQRNPSSIPRSIVYVQSYKTTSGDHLSLLPLIQHQTYITHVYLAAVHVNQDPGDIRLNDKYLNDPIFDPVWSDAAQLQRSGVKVVMMIGGSAQGSFQRLCSGNVINDQYYVPLRKALQHHKVDGVDLDIEEEVEMSCPLALLRRFDRDFGSDFILTMAPVASELSPSEYGLSGLSYSSLDAQATSSTRPNGKLVSWYNVQFYNGWGYADTPDNYISIINNGYSPNRVVMGVLDSPGDGGGGSEATSGWNLVNTYKNTISALRSNYPDFGGFFGWEYWDAGTRDNCPEPWRWVQEMGAAVHGPSDAVHNITARPSSHRQSPWPVATKMLENMGVLYLQAIRSLNISEGSLDAAVALLGITDVS